ncbi:hypothetical protein GGC64_000653 [Mycobacterium sp. OAS707]|uniref:hypothetical protein n=1 Tax=Mycobacterium sp. OAS707 TaxID=2663822 RepID=UPI00178AF47C|nr:hypothetical protein [Mycobacterium sp. OAS707]MBE1546645.1 hypothetical protein [Mycobacterium sp. OAS707]
MNVTKIRNRFAAGVVGTAIVAAPALLIGAGTAQAASNLDPHPATTITIEHPGHIAIQVEPAPVSAPIVWGQYDSPTYILND